MTAYSELELEDAAVVLVTGAAGAIGSATVQAFLSAGYLVAGLDQVPVQRTEAGLRTVVVDVTDSDAVGEAVGSLQDLGSLAHVILIAGGAVRDEVGVTDPRELELETFKASVHLNLVSQFAVLKAVLPWLDASKTLTDRSIIFTSSVNASTGFGMPGYSAAKAGLLGLVHALAGPLGQTGIRVNAVVPGTVETPRRYEQKALRATTSIGRFAAPDDIAAAYLAAANLRHMTGQTLVVDGGQTVGA